MYSIAGFGRMIADRARTGPYVEALRRAVRPGSVVVDIGTGTGFFALVACQLGARRVYALEPNDAIHLARQMAAANGCADRIQFIQLPSERASLPEKADVIVSDLHGLMPLFERHIPSIIDARERWLAPGGTLIPQRDLLHAAIITVPDFAARFEQPFAANPYGLNLTAGQRAVTGFLQRIPLTPEQLLTEPQTWCALDFRSIQSANTRADLTWTLARGGVAHGIGVWFDTELLEGIGFSNAPGVACKVFGQGFLPWSSPVEVQPGDTLSVSLQATLVGDDYVWAWNSSIRNARGEMRQQFRQSTLAATLFSPDQLRKHADGYVPTRNAEAEVDLHILNEMNGAATLEEIARRIAAQFPDRFATPQETLNHVGRLSDRYSR